MVLALFNSTTEGRQEMSVDKVKAPRTREEISARRQVRILGPVGGALIYPMVHLMSYGNTVPAKYSLFFGSVQGWPDFVRHGFVPIDAACSVAYCWLLMYELMVALFIQHKVDYKSRRKGLKGLLLGGLWFFVSSGSIGGMIGTATYGWYFGIEYFVVFGLLMTGIAGAVLGVAAGIFWCGKKLSPASKKLWLRARTTPVARPIVKIGEYLDAKDVADQPTKPEEQ
jgi:hypothetical protein